MKKKIKSLNLILFIIFMIFSSSMIVSSAAEETEYSMLLDKVTGENIETYYIERPNPKALEERVVNASLFGLSVTNEDNYNAFSKALEYCKNNPNTYLTIDKGVYYFKTNASLELSGLKNVLIEGNGAEFIFETQKQFVLDGCDGVELRDLYIDWNWAKDRVASLVKVHNKTDSSFEIEFLELDEVDVDIPLVSFQQYDSKDLVPGAYGSWKTFNPYEVPGSILSVEKVEPNVLKLNISNKFTTSFHNEEVYILRHYTYGGSVFNVYGGSKNITFDNVNIYGSAGMGFVFGKNANHFQLINSYIGLRPGNEDKQRMSTSADGIHILNTNGFFRIDNCDFSYTGDDIINIHDDMLKVTKIYSANQLTGNVTGGFVEKGEKIRIYNKNLEDIGFETEVTAFTRKGDAGTLTLKDKLPDEVSEGFYIYRSSNSTHNYVISNNYIHETKGRGALLNASDGLFENNTLYRTVSECVEVRMDLSDQTNKFWYEGTGAKNVLIKDNIFKECAFGGKEYIIKIDCNLGKNKNVLSDIYIKNNEFLYCYGAETLISADNVTNLHIENNIISDSGDILISDYCGAVYNSGNKVLHPSESCSHNDTKKVCDRPAGCFEYGSTGKTYCNQCHTIIDSSIRGIPPIKHKDSLVKVVNIEPTCTKDGSSNMVCSLCRTVVETGITESAKGHTVVTDKAVAATCTTAGKTEGSHCSVCNTVIKAQETVKATGHKYVDKVTAPTYDAKGYTTHTCSVCGDSYKDTYIAALTEVTFDVANKTVASNSSFNIKANYSGLTWKSSDTQVATVDQSGKVTALRFGKATITATSSDGKSSASCVVNVLFHDVAGSSDKTATNYQYYYAPVYWAANAGITTGYDKVYFGVGEDCTRAAVMIFLWRMSGCPSPKDDANKYFKDVKAYSTSTATNKAIAWAYENGISKGYSDGTFGVKKSITRKDVLIMLYRIAGKPSVTGTMKFSDCKSYAKGTDTYNAILWGSTKGITNGYADGTFKPTDNCLREQIITFLYRYAK